MRIPNKQPIPLPPLTLRNPPYHLSRLLLILMQRPTRKQILRHPPKRRLRTKRKQITMRTIPTQQHPFPFPPLPRPYTRQTRKIPLHVARRVDQVEGAVGEEIVGVREGTEWFPFWGIG